MSWTCAQGVCTWMAEGCKPCFDCVRTGADFSPCSSAYTLGIVLAVISALCNGTFGSLAKTRRVQAAQVPPYIFNFWTCAGVAACSGAVAMLTGWRCLSWLGVLSGALFASSTASAFLAIKLLGLSPAAGIWCGTAVLVSFAFGAVTEQSILRPHLAMLALVALLCGIGGIAAAGWLHQAMMLGNRSGSSATWHGWRQRRRQRQWQQQQQQQQQQEPHHLPHLEAGDVEGCEQPLTQPLLSGFNGDNDHSGRGPSSTLPPADAATTPAAPGGNRNSNTPADAAATPTAPGGNSMQASLGAAAAVATGLQGGLILAPMSFAGYQCSGLPYVPAMGAGVALAAPLITWLVHVLSRQVSLPLPLQPATAAVPGLISGAIWATGNVASILAVQYVGLAIAYPIMQCGLFVAGMWGIIVFGELRGSATAMALYWGAGVVLVAGATLLALSGLAG